MKRNILNYIVILLFVSSCDNRKDNYIGMDAGPKLQVATLTDTNYYVQISDSEKLGHTYIFKYVLESFENLTLNINKSNVYDSLIINSETLQINVRPSCVEQATYKLSVMDPFNKYAQASVELTVFKNLIPICIFTDTLIAQLSTYQVQIDASKSFDQDAKWGGAVVKYQFMIDQNYTCTTTMATIDYIFDGPGQKVITVRCQDNDSAWSAPVTKYLTIKN